MKSITTLLFSLLFLPGLSVAQHEDVSLAVVIMNQPVLIYEDLNCKLAYDVRDMRDACREIRNVKASCEGCNIRLFSTETWELFPTSPEGKITLYLEEDDGSVIELDTFLFKTIKPNFDDPFFHKVYPPEARANKLSYTDSYVPDSNRLVPNEHYMVTPYAAILEYPEPGATYEVQVSYSKPCYPIPQIEAKVGRKFLEPSPRTNRFVFHIPEDEEIFEVEYYGIFDGKRELITKMRYPVEEAE